MSVRFVPPMAALLVNALPTGDEWLYEAKFDGYRALALKDGASVKILSRKGNDLTADYPAIRLALGALKAKSAVIDGEVVAFDESGRPSFHIPSHRSAIPRRFSISTRHVLALNGKDLQDESSPHAAWPCRTTSPAPTWCFRRRFRRVEDVVRPLRTSG